MRSPFGEPCLPSLLRPPHVRVSGGIVDHLMAVASRRDATGTLRRSRWTSTGIGLWLSTLTVSLPSSSADAPCLP